MRAAAWAAFAHLPVMLLLAAASAGPGRWRAVHAGAALAIAAIGVDAFLVEPHALQVVRYTICSDELDAPLRIVALSDVQTDHVGAYERSAFERAMAEHPDLIVLPGDFVQAWPRQRGAQVAALRELLPILQAPLGVWAVQGNVDPPGWAEALFGGTHVRAADATTTVDLGPIRLSALSFADGFDPALTLPHQPGFHLAFAHGPDFSLSPGVDADLLIAGHTHGGQVQLPLVGPLLTLTRVPRAAGRGGLTALSGDRALIVSRGVGMERGRAPRLRIGCRPQIVVVDLVPAP
ncbi:MAG: hypothetical protein R3F59_27665 [Myxococcota bacterium]